MQIYCNILQPEGPKGCCTFQESHCNDINSNRYPVRLSYCLCAGWSEEVPTFNLSPTTHQQKRLRNYDAKQTFCSLPALSTPLFTPYLSPQMSTSTPIKCHNIPSHPPEAIPPSTAPAVSARRLQSWPWLVPAPRPSMAAGCKCRTSSQIRWQAVPGRANAEKSEATQSWAVFGLVGSVLFSVEHVRLIDSDI